VKKWARLRLVGEGEGSGASRVFDDIDKLRADLAAAGGAPDTPASSAVVGGDACPARRSKAKETFAPIPHDRALELYRRRIGGPAWAVLIELDRMIFAGRGRNPILFWSPRLRAAGLTRHTRARALRELEAAGVVEVTWRERRFSPLVRHRWYPRHG
jgi:hypothetical protein